MGLEVKSAVDPVYIVVAKDLRCPGMREIDIV
jgi:hypothetical protein